MLKFNLFFDEIKATHICNLLSLMYRRNNFGLFNKKKRKKYYFVHLYRVKSVKSFPGEESLPAFTPSENVSTVSTAHCIVAIRV